MCQVGPRWPGVQFVFWVVLLDVFVVVHQLHLRPMPEAARVIREDTASPHIVCAPIPRKDALVVRCADDLQLKTVK